MARAAHGHSQSVRTKPIPHSMKHGAPAPLPASCPLTFSPARVLALPETARGFRDGDTMFHSPPWRRQQRVPRCWKIFSVSRRSLSHCFVWRRRHSTLAARASRTICSWAAMTLCCLRPSRMSSASCKDQTSRPAASCSGRRPPEPINPRPASHRRRPFPCRAQPSRLCVRGAHGPFRPHPGI